MATRKKARKRTVSGTTKRTRKSAATTHRRKRIGYTRVASTRYAKPTTAYHRGQKILKEIDRFEAQLRKTKDPEKRRFLIHVINHEHDKLDTVMAGMKKRA